MAPVRARLGPGTLIIAVASSTMNDLTKRAELEAGLPDTCIDEIVAPGSYRATPDVASPSGGSG